MNTLREPGEAQTLRHRVALHAANARAELAHARLMQDALGVANANTAVAVHERALNRAIRDPRYRVPLTERWRSAWQRWSQPTPPSKDNLAPPVIREGLIYGLLVLAAVVMAGVAWMGGL